MADHPASRPPEKEISPSARIAILKTLASIASTEASVQFGAFVSRLSAALFEQLDPSAQSSDDDISLNAFRHLNKNKATFHRLLSACVTDALLQEIGALDAPETSRLERDAMDLTLVTFEAMEHKVLIDNLGQALNGANTRLLDALNVRIAHLLQTEVRPAQNPFRPEVFLKAVCDAWSKFDLAKIGGRVVLRELQPEVFLQLEPILQALNDALIARGVLPDLPDAHPPKNAAQSPGEATRRNLPLYSKLNRWLPSADGSGKDIGIAPALLAYLSDLQRQAPVDAAVIRQVKKQAPRGALSEADENALELLARMFDFVFREQHIPADFKTLLGQLQIPVLKAALADKEFFFMENHPARRLVETVARASVTWNQEQDHDDPLYQIVEQVVERVRQEYDRQIELFDAVAAALDAFIADEARQSEAALSQTIAEVLRQENLHRAKELAGNDVAMRIETGEVPGFLEVFLERHWARVLGLARGMQETKPEVLQKTLKTMDDLIWSVKPKAGPEQRKELLSKLPAMLSMLNAWLNVVKWDGPERVEFFSTLAGCHAAIVRTQVDLSPRQQLEVTLDIVERASERRLNKRAEEQPEVRVDDFVHQVDGLEPGTWIELVSNAGKEGIGGMTAKVELAWISPRRSRFVITGRRGQDPFTLTFDELVQLFRDRRARVVAADAVLDRAINAVLDEIA
jgi:hypothetical protein